MKDRPIIFNTEMVQAILDDRKSQTRRVIKPQLLNPTWTGTRWVESGNDNTIHFEIKCPYGKIGDRLWVRETWAVMEPAIIRYKAGGKDYFFNAIPLSLEYVFTKHGSSWRPSIFMPRIASRITLEITDIRVERVQDITRSDIRAEGLVCPEELKSDDVSPNYKEWYLKAFKDLWDSINAKRGYSWKSNPWVWVIQFKKELKQ